MGATHTQRERWVFIGISSTVELNFLSNKLVLWFYYVLESDRKKLCKLLGTELLLLTYVWSYISY